MTDEKTVGEEGPAVPAAWLTDPIGRHEYRFWDGQQWTAHVSDAGVVGSDPLAPPTAEASGAAAQAIPTEAVGAAAEGDQLETETPTAAFAPPPLPVPAASAAATAPQTTEPTKPWYKRRWVLITAGVVAVLFVIGALAGSNDSNDKKTASKSVAAATAVPTTPTAAPTTPTVARTTPTVAPTTQAPKPTAPPAPVETPGQANARRSAQQYLSLGHGFSRAGLIQQLSSSYGEGFSLDDATYGVDATHADWNAQACLSAKGYLKLEPFSHEGLVEQLSSEAGEQFTPDEAEYGVTCAGL